jgi:large subunit ribosomal protein L31
MKAKIHPSWYPEAKISCSCGHTFTAGSTLPEINVEICSQCHPFFTGKMKFIDTQGRVEKFQAKQAAAKTKAYIKKKDRHRLKEIKENARPRTLREMLQQKSASKH